MECERMKYLSLQVLGRPGGGMLHHGPFLIGCIDSGSSGCARFPILSFHVSSFIDTFFRSTCPLASTLSASSERLFA